MREILTILNSSKIISPTIETTLYPYVNPDSFNGVEEWILAAFHAISVGHHVIAVGGGNGSDLCQPLKVQLHGEQMESCTDKDCQINDRHDNAEQCHESG